MNLKYKKATTENVPLIRQLANRIWKQHYMSIITMEQIDYMLNKMYSDESLSNQMKQGHQFTLVYDGDKAIGYISIESKDGRNYFLHKFYIETTDQRKGVGAALFAHVQKELKSAESIELTVNRQNFKAINFYFKNGFTIKEVADFDIGNGYFMNDFVMIKNMK